MEKREMAYLAADAVASVCVYLEYAFPTQDWAKLSVADAATVTRRLMSTEWTLAEAARHVANAIAEEG